MRWWWMLVASRILSLVVHHHQHQQNNVVFFMFNNLFRVCTMYIHRHIKHALLSVWMSSLTLPPIPLLLTLYLPKRSIHMFKYECIEFIIWRHLMGYINVPNITAHTRSRTHQFVQPDQVTRDRNREWECEEHTALYLCHYILFLISVTISHRTKNRIS